MTVTERLVDGVVVLMVVGWMTVETRDSDLTRLVKGRLADADGREPEVLLLATGTEVALCVDASEALKADGVQARVVSMPSWELFEQQSREYRDDVFQPSITARVAVEQASTMGWDRYVGVDGCIIGMETFGSSAPLKDLQQKFGFTPGRIVEAAREQTRRST